MWFNNISPCIPVGGGREIRTCLRAVNVTTTKPGVEIYKGMNKICNEICCPLKFYKDTILTFEDTSGAAAAACCKFDKEASDASSQSF